MNRVEWAGNKLPEPFMLFLILFAITGVISTAMAWADVSVTVPGSDEPTVIKGLFTGEGMTWPTTNLRENYVGLPPLVAVLPILLAIGMTQPISEVARASAGAVAGLVARVVAHLRLSVRSSTAWVIRIAAPRPMATLSEALGSVDEGIDLVSA